MDQKIKCSQCGVEFPSSELIAYEHFHVCAGCKGSFVQKIKEGAPIATDHHFAGFWIRAGALLIDGIILGLLQWGVSWIVYQIFPQPHPPAGSKTPVMGTGYYINLFFSFAFAIAYNIWFVGKYAATLGKMACGIKIIRADGSPVGYGRACGRYFGQYLSGFTLGIGYIMAGIDKEKRSLHDRVCNTRVIYK